MRRINLEINGDTVTKDRSVVGVQGSGNVDVIRMTFDESWDGYAKSAAWWDAHGAPAEKRTLTADLLEDITEGYRTYLVPVPAGALLYAGSCVLVIEGYKEGQRARTVEVPFTVEGAPTLFSSAAEVLTPSAEERLQYQVDTLLADISERARLAKSYTQGTAEETVLLEGALPSNWRVSDSGYQGTLPRIGLIPGSRYFVTMETEDDVVEVEAVAFRTTAQLQELVEEPGAVELLGLFDELDGEQSETPADPPGSGQQDPSGPSQEDPVTPPGTGEPADITTVTMNAVAVEVPGGRIWESVDGAGAVLELTEMMDILSVRVISDREQNAKEYARKAALAQGAAEEAQEAAEEAQGAAEAAQAAAEQAQAAGETAQEGAETARVGAEEAQEAAEEAQAGAQASQEVAEAAEMENRQLAALARHYAIGEGRFLQTTETKQLAGHSPADLVSPSEGNGPPLLVGGKYTVTVTHEGVTETAVLVPKEEATEIFGVVIGVMTGGAVAAGGSGAENSRKISFKNLNEYDVTVTVEPHADMARFGEADQNAKHYSEVAKEYAIGTGESLSGSGTIQAGRNGTWSGPRVEEGVRYLVTVTGGGSSVTTMAETDQEMMTVGGVTFYASNMVRAARNNNAYDVDIFLLKLENSAKALAEATQVMNDSAQQAREGAEAARRTVETVQAALHLRKRVYVGTSDDVDQLLIGDEMYLIDDGPVTLEANYQKILWEAQKAAAGQENDLENVAVLSTINATNWRMDEQGHLWTTDHVAEFRTKITDFARAAVTAGYVDPNTGRCTGTWGQAQYYLLREDLITPMQDAQLSYPWRELRPKSRTEVLIEEVQAIKAQLAQSAASLAAIVNGGVI